MDFIMQIIDPKPFGAFIEYTVKPILEEIREIFELTGNDYKTLKKYFKLSVIIFIVERILTTLKTISVTIIVCWTVLQILSLSPSLAK